MDQYKLLDWLNECDGDSIWNPEYCIARGIPDYLIHALEDAYESGFNSESETIFYGDKPVSQFEGIRDVDLAIWIGKQLKVDVKRILSRCVTRTAIVQAIKEEFEEG